MDQMVPSFKDACRQLLPNAFEDKPRKIFFVGQNKCATTQISGLAREYGMSARHSTDWVHWVVERRPAAGNFWQFDVFADGPVHVLSSRDFLFLHSFCTPVFVVQFRNLKDWLISRFNHVERFKREGEIWRKNDEPTIIRWIYEREYQNRKMKLLQRDLPSSVIFMPLENLSSSITDLLSAVFSVDGVREKLKKSFYSRNKFKDSSGYSSDPDCVLAALSKLRIPESVLDLPFGGLDVPFEELEAQVRKNIPTHLRSRCV